MTHAQDQRGFAEAKERFAGFADPIAGNINVSFEFFPPNTPKMEETLWESIKRLEPLNPDFVSVTYGAGGSTRERTHNTVIRILEETDLKPASHLTCVGAPKSEIDEIVQRYYDHGVRHIVALRGDPPADADHYTPHPDGYQYASDLVAGIKAVASDIDVSVACYPESHPDSPDWDTEIDNLKRKVDAGADRAITQFFFDVELYARFLDRVQAAGINVPVVPGIMPVLNFTQAKRFSDGAGASVPDWLGDLYGGLEKDAETRKLVAAMVAADQCRQLNAWGVETFHFYTLNRADLTYAICHILGIRPSAEGEVR